MPAFLTEKAKAIDPQGARVLIRLIAVELYFFAHLPFADCRIGDLPGLALIIHERRLPAMFCAAKVATGLVCILFNAFLVTNRASHVNSLVLVLGSEEWSRRKNKSYDANHSFYVFISHVCLLDAKNLLFPILSD